MTVETETLAALKSLNTLLNNQIAAASRSTGAIAAGSGAPTSSGRTSKYNAQAVRREEESKILLHRTTVKSAGSIKRLGDVSERGAESLISLNRGFNGFGLGMEGLSTAVGRTLTMIKDHTNDFERLNLSGMFSPLEEAINNSATIAARSSSVNFDSLSSSLESIQTIVGTKVLPRLESFESALSKASSTMMDLWTEMNERQRSSASDLKSFGLGLGIAVAALTRRQGVGTYFERFISQLRRASAAIRELRISARGGGVGGGGGSSRSTSTSALDEVGSSKNASAEKRDGWFKSTFLNPLILAGTVAAQRTFSSLVKIVDNAFEVTGSRGFGVFNQNFQTLSSSALKAGMSLEEYVKLMSEMDGTVSRFKSFEAFDAQLEVGRQSLKEFGVFGIDATRLSAAMVSSAQSLGTPIDDITSSVNGQMKVFEQLRKTTSLTAEEFAEINQVLQESEVVQREMLGLSPQERAARKVQLTETASWGKAIGLTKSAANELTNALLGQRKTTVKERFEARGRLQQSMAVVGMDSATIAEAAALTSKRVKSGPEEIRLTQILGDYKSRAEEIKQGGNEGMAYLVEESEAKLDGTSLKPLLDASIQVKLAIESGQQVNAKMGTTLTNIEIKIGEAIQKLEGLSKSPLIQFGVGALVTATALLNANAAMQNASLPARIALAFKSAFPMLGSGSGSGPSPLDGGKGRLLKFLPYIGTAVAVGMAANDFKNAKENAKEDGGDANKKQAEAIGSAAGAMAGQLTGGVIGRLVGAALGSVVPGLGTVIGGLIGTYLGSLGGEWFGGKLVENTALEKNTEEVKKNNEEVKKNNDLVKKKNRDVTLDMMSSNQLSSLGSQVVHDASRIVKMRDDERQATAQATATPVSRVPIVTPISPVPTTVAQQTAINTAAAAAVTATNASSIEASKPKLPQTPEQSAVLTEILKVLQETLSVENAHADLTSQLLRQPAFSSAIPDKSARWKYSIRTA